jgi:hypothetical protein
MKNLYLAIIAQILTAVLDPVKYEFDKFAADIWLEGTLTGMKAPKENDTYSIQLPAVLVEIDEGLAEMLGDGVQIFPDMTIKFHLIHRQETNPDGLMNRNTDALDLQDILYQTMQKFIAPGTNEFIRSRPMEDFSHDNVYHYVIEYKTTYVDQLMLEPVGGKTIPGNTIIPSITITE